jgi:hypothetical protein
MMNDASSAMAVCLFSPDHTTALATVAATLVAAAALYFARWYYVSEQMGRLHNRLLELNKMAVEHPQVAKDFFDLQHAPVQGYFSGAAKRGRRLYALRGYVLFRLNVYEEAFCATQGPYASGTSRGKAWQHYIKKSFDHPLIQEMFAQTADQFDEDFVRFIERNELPGGDLYRPD